MLQYINKNGSAMTFDIKLSADPYSQAGIDWAKAIQAAFPSTECPGCPIETYYLMDGSQDMYDIQDTVYELLPLAMVVTLCVVFVIVGASYRSLVVPLRAVVTIVFTLTIVFGASVAVYQHGALSWTGLECLEPIADQQICWLIPVMSFSILTGLAVRRSLPLLLHVAHLTIHVGVRQLDYDVFIISRVAVRLNSARRRGRSC